MLIFMVSHKSCSFSVRSSQWRIQGGAEIGCGGSPPLTNFFFRAYGHTSKNPETHCLFADGTQVSDIRPLGLLLRMVWVGG